MLPKQPILLEQIKTMFPQQQLFPIHSHTSYKREDFTVSTANQEAFFWLTAPRPWINPWTVLYGPAGSGKTHLAHVWSQNQARFVDSLSGDLYELIKLSNKFVLDPLERFIETPESLFHFLNFAKEHGREVLMLSYHAPNHLEIELKDLSSRLRSAHVLYVDLPDDELLYAVIRKVATDHHIIMSDEVIRYILNRSERSFEMIKTVVAAVAVESLREHADITIPFVKSILIQLMV